MSDSSSKSLWVILAIAIVLIAVGLVFMRSDESGEPQPDQARTATPSTSPSTTGDSPAPATPGQPMAGEEGGGGSPGLEQMPGRISDRVTPLVPDAERPGLLDDPTLSEAAAESTGSPSRTRGEDGLRAYERPVERQTISQLEEEFGPQPQLPPEVEEALSNPPPPDLPENWDEIVSSPPVLPPDVQAVLDDPPPVEYDPETERIFREQPPVPLPPGVQELIDNPQPVPPID